MSSRIERAQAAPSVKPPRARDHKAADLSPLGRPMRVQARSIATRQQILLASATLFREEGYKATTLRDIAKSVDMGAGSLYYHFSSKEEILEEVLQLGIVAINRAVGDAVDALPSSVGPSARLDHAIRAALGALIETGEYTTAYTRIYNQLPRSVKPLDHPQRQSYMNRWRALVKAAQAVGEIRGDLPVETFVEFLHGAISRTPEWYGAGHGSVEDLARLIGQWVLHGVATPTRRNTPRV